MTITARAILFCCLILVLFHIWGTIHPAHSNWGVHHYAFFDAPVAIIALTILFLFFIPAVQRTFTNRFEQLLRVTGTWPMAVSFSVVAGLLLLLIYLFPVRGHLLGDSAILLRSVPRGIMGDEIPPNFRNQPLMFWAYRWVMFLYPVDSSPDPVSVYFAIDIIAALGYLLLIFWTMRKLDLLPIEKTLLGILLFVGGGSIFFFGYVENYVLQYVITTAYLITGWFALEKRLTPLVPILCFIVMALLHLGNLVFLPSVMVLMLLKWGKNGFRFALVLGGLAVGAVLVAIAVGFQLSDLTRHLKTGSVDFLQPFTAIGGNFPYAMFSWAHLLDWTNSQLTVVPCGLFLTIILTFSLPREQRWRNPALVFLLASACCGLFFTWVINSALGLARDWDLFASFFVPLMVLPIYLFSRPTLSAHRPYVLVLVVVISFLHWTPRVLLNSNADRHLARMKMLNDPMFLSLTTQLTYDEALANFFFDSNQFADARKYYEHFLTIDSTNPRIIGNIADVYRKIGERDRYFRMLQRAVNLHSPDPGVYSNLGVEYAYRGDTAMAITLNEKAVSINPTMQKAIANLGMLYTSQRKFELADKYFSTALELGMRDKLLLRYAGDVCVFLNQYERALHNYDDYLALVPDDRNVRYVRDQIYKALTETKK